MESTNDKIVINDASGASVTDFCAHQKKKKTQKFSVGRFIIYAILILYTIWIMMPFLVILITSFVSSEEYADSQRYIWFTFHPTLEGYERIFLDDPFKTSAIPSLFVAFFNSMWISVLPMGFGLLVSALVAYVFSKTEFPCKNTLFLLTVTTMFIPLGAFGFVSYMFYQALGWTEGWKSVLPLIIPGLFGSASTVFFLRPYIDGVNGETIEAAKIDGMGFWQIFFRVILPLSKPALIAQFIFGFVGGYNNYSGALLYLGDGDPSLWTLQLMLKQLISYGSDSQYSYNVSCATALMSMIPLIIVYLCCQRYFIEGISFGGGKE